MTNAPILDLLIQLKNASLSGKKTVTLPGSSFKISLLDLLKSNNYISDYSKKTENNKTTLQVELLYNNRQPAISDIKIYSRPGRRAYTRADALPWGESSKSLIIISSSKGLVSAKQAAKQNIGGELIAQVN